MPGRSRTLLALVAAAAVTVVGCAPSGLDAEQAKAEARECASLLERHVSGRTPPGRIVVDGTTIDLGSDAERFYSVLEDERGPEDFPLTGGRAATAQRASFISDLCKAKDASSSASTSTTTTVAPGDTVGGG